MRRGTTRIAPLTLAALASVIIAGMGLAGCSSGLDSSQAAREALSEAKRQLDRARTVAFEVEGDKLPDDGVLLLGGQGVAKRPDSFRGRFRLSTSGVSSTVRVVSVEGQLYARLPMTTEFAEVEPSDLGIPDPARLLDPEQGMSTLLADAGRVRPADQIREGDEVLDEVTATVPAESVGRFLYVASPEGGIRTTFRLERDTHELRSATFTGPFYGEDDRSRYTITLDEYGEPVRIERP